MVEVNITYETLFDLLRREKGRNELQELDKNFYDDVFKYLNEKKSSLVSGSLTSRAEKEKIQIQIKNAHKIIKELYEIREKKIMNLAANKVRTNSSLINTAMMLEKEKELFEEVILVLRRHKESNLSFLDLPAREDKIEEKPSKQETKKEEIKESDKKEVTSNTNEFPEVIITTNLPKFMGLDQKIYGPFTSGDKVKLPKKIAELLLNKSRAKLV